MQQHTLYMLSLVLAVGFFPSVYRYEIKGEPRKGMKIVMWSFFLLFTGFLTASLLLWMFTFVVNIFGF